MIPPGAEAPIKEMGACEMNAGSPIYITVDF